MSELQPLPELDPEKNLHLIKPVGLPPLMVVSFSIPAPLAPAFDDFYHNQFLPELFSLSPQLRSIQRFEKYDIETGEAAQDGEFYTFYELDSEETLDKTDAIFGHIQFAKTLSVFKEFKETSLTSFKRVNYSPIHAMERPPDGAGLAPAVASCCYLVYLEAYKGEQDKFLDWYLGQYQPQVPSQAPDLVACHSYKLYEPAPAPVRPRLMTVYGAGSESALKTSLEQLNQSHLGKQNETWKAFCQDLIVVNLSSVAVRSIFSLP